MAKMSIDVCYQWDLYCKNYYRCQAYSQEKFDDQFVTEAVAYSFIALGGDGSSVIDIHIATFVSLVSMKALNMMISLPWTFSITIQST